MKSPFARFNLSPSRLEVVVMITLSAIFMVGAVGAGSSLLTDAQDGNAVQKTTTAPGVEVSTADGRVADAGGRGTDAQEGATAVSGPSSSQGRGPSAPGKAVTAESDGAASGRNGTDPEASGTGPDGSGTGSDGSGTSSDGSGTGSDDGGPSVDGGGTGSDGSGTTPSAPTGARTVTISMVVHRAQGDFSKVAEQPFRGVCQPDGIRREHEGGEPLWAQEPGAVAFGTPLRLTFEVPADQQVWCAFYLQPHAHWERVSDVQANVNGTSHAATNVECLIPAVGQSYSQTVEASQYLPGRSDGCDVAYTISH